jgi:chromate transporter
VSDSFASLGDQLASAATLERLPPRPTDLLLVWLRAASQAIGGGGSGVLSAYNTIVETRRWLSAETWAECWAICQIVPGVNIMAMALLTGSRLAGWGGAIASLGGLVGPSIVATVGITLLYSRIQGVGTVQSGLHGLMAAAAAGSIMFSWRLASPAVRANLSRGRWAAAVMAVILVGSALLVHLTRIPVFILLLTGGAAMASTTWLGERRARLARS